MPSSTVNVRCKALIQQSLLLLQAALQAGLQFIEALGLGLQSLGGMKLGQALFQKAARGFRVGHRVIELTVFHKQRSQQVQVLRCGLDYAHGEPLFSGVGLKAYAGAMPQTFLMLPNLGRKRNPSKRLICRLYATLCSRHAAGSRCADHSLGAARLTVALVALRRLR